MAHSSCAGLADANTMRAYLESATERHPWAWPTKPIVFVADPHADAVALHDSLRLAGLLSDDDVSGPGRLVMNERAADTEIIIGGDCLDKGPSNLGLLRALRCLLDSDAEVTLLAGNHDLRVIMGLQSIGSSDSPTTEHLFLRMGPKAVPLLREVFDEYVAPSNRWRHVPDEATCRRLLYPADGWSKRFAESVKDWIPAPAVNRELIRMQRKLEAFESACAALGMGLREVYAAARQCRHLFCRADGEFAWFRQRMQLLTRRGSFLFVHAGVDDELLALLARHGTAGVNRRFHSDLAADAFALYHGVVGNGIRTKYRGVDLPLTSVGLRWARRIGVHAVVHGHRNRTAGQRLALREGLLHIESDVTLDRNSRRQEGLNGVGAGVTVIQPSGQVLGISADYPVTKCFSPASYLADRDDIIHAA
jgi:hypothetical protein